MNLDRDMYLVVLNHANGPYIPETDLARTGIKIVTEDLMHGQYEDVLAVIEVNPIDHVCREVTHDFKPVIEDAERAAARRREGLPDID
jgi:hypothetical protein